MRKGERMTSEQKLKISKSNTGKIRTLQQRKNISRGCKGVKRSDEARQNIRNGHRGPQNYLWKGNNIGYRTLHHWVQSELGKPHKCEHCLNEDLPHRSYHWANKSGQYKRKLSDWVRLCVKCHKKYDARKRLLRRTK